MQRNPSGDQELNLKKRARRRLVGAIALVLLMVVVLPMILKDRAASQPQDKITITLPGEQQTVTPATTSDFDSSIVPAEPLATDMPEHAVAADPEAAPAKPEKAVPAIEAPVKETAKPKEEGKHKFYVQIGVFSDETKVKKMQTKLSDLGYKSQTEKITKPKGIRLRTQLFGDRNEAMIALDSIKDAGLTDSMVVSQ